MQRRFELLVENQKLVGDIFLPDGFGKPFPVMICSHGRETNRKRGKWPKIAERFPGEGIAVITFDHRGALGGESEGKFEDTTLTSRVEDLEVVLKFSKTIPEIDSNKIILLGSSLGGKTALLVAARNEKIKGLVLLATSFNLPIRLSERIKKTLNKESQRYNLKEEGQKIKCPTLILHGTLDELIPRHHAHILKKYLSNSELIEIEGADHAFTDPEKLNEVLDKISNWLKKLLKEV